MLNGINLSRTDLNLLVLFDAVMRERHVGRAAGAMNLTPSAVSHGLARLRRLLNDPLFLRTPRGVVPTERALELEAPIAEVLSRVRGVVAMAEPFDPAVSKRRFAIGAPDALSAVLMRDLLADLQKNAPHVNIGLRHMVGGRARVFDRTLDEILPLLETREIDIAILPVDEVPARFLATRLYLEEFVAVFRKGHPFGNDPSLENYCRLRHLLVSQVGDPVGFVDKELARLERSRRVAVTVPNFIAGLLLLSETDLVSAMPRRLVSTYADRFGLSMAEIPFEVEPSAVCLVAPRAALLDAGIVWLHDAVTASFAKTADPGAPARLDATSPER